MTTPLKIGDRLVRTLLVDEERTIPFMGDDLRVYATPEIVWDAEMACRDLYRAHLGPDEDSLGVYVEIHHVAGGLPGHEVEISATVREIDGRRVVFAFEARDAEGVVAHGRHDRVAVALDRARARLTAKRARLSGDAPA